MFQKSCMTFSIKTGSNMMNWRDLLSTRWFIRSESALVKPDREIFEVDVGVDPAPGEIDQGIIKRAA